jgi:hypothetical protein
MGGDLGQCLPALPGFAAAGLRYLVQALSNAALHGFLQRSVLAQGLRALVDYFKNGGKSFGIVHVYGLRSASVCWVPKVRG